MRLLTDAEVRSFADPVMAAEAVSDAFSEAARGETALLARQRISAAGLKLSAMSAILPGEGVAGAKVYTTIDGAFRFVVVLFDAASGAPLAVLEADALTEIRTAAVTEVVAARASPGQGGKIAVFGTGVQARAHVRALARRLRPVKVAIVSRGEAGALAADLSDETGVVVMQADPGDAVRGARVVVTATRSSAPLFDGRLLDGGCFVAAVGSTLPHARELDDATMGRAAWVLVEDRGQALAEAGDLGLALESGALDRERILDLASYLSGGPVSAAGRSESVGRDVTVFKSVGIALEDVAVAARIWRRAEEVG